MVYGMAVYLWRLYRYRASILWRGLAARLGDWKNVIRRRRRKCERDVIDRIFRYLVADNGNEYMTIDSLTQRRITPAIPLKDEKSSAKENILRALQGKESYPGLFQQTQNVSHHLNALR